MENTSYNSDPTLNITLDKMLSMSQSCFEIWFIGLTQSQKLHAAKLLRGELMQRHAKAQVQIPDFLNRSQWQRQQGIPSVLEEDK